MHILVLNGSPRVNGNTSAMVDAFVEGAQEKGHSVKVIAVCRKEIAGCVGCEYCHTRGGGRCVQQDDMEKIYEALEQADMLALASPVYYFGFTGQLQCAVSRFYALEKLGRVKQTALILSSGSDDVYEGCIYEYKESFTEYMGLEDKGIFTAFGDQNKSEEKLAELREFGRSL
ncbi:MAG: flavodoxin family protein [Desulfovibrionaceae bacterium]|nr:flavodoxin family protein [Desulfovibrionaceae bacterium]